ncbi:NAD(P)-dependent oxidoreductase [Streptomyces griseocarneus]|uniref:NAD(P)-dependent oxidoreductase n=1 Tax=Streptomyces griseocarneus TaxID=51201 RepID=UPI00167E8201|nr:NAD(P)-binding domain-containing protein [Streptomyces griseocarneus]MBZ6474758.1 NAD(P)-binding domain-containing protein [Streptomyces griseocarneus]GHG47932.1 3-hydroxyisobutyrate dehydrogenase [Streptomyces griseocarneus]
MSTDVTVLGLGPMGSALAGAFVAAGHRTTVWNRTPGKAEALVRRGAVEAESAGEALGASPLTVVSLSTYEAVRDVLRPVAGELAGRALVNLTSGPPVCAREMDAWAGQAGAHYLDGVVMTTPSGIGSRDFLQLYAGSATAFERHRETLAALGDATYVGTDTALSSVYDTTLLCQMWSTLTGWLHSVVLIGAEGPGGNVTAAEYTEVANRWMDTVRFFMSTYAAQVDSGEYPSGDFPLDLHRSTMEILTHASELRGADTGMPKLFRALTERAIAAGHGNDSYARLVEFVRREGRPGATLP